MKRIGSLLLSMLLLLSLVGCEGWSMTAETESSAVSSEALVSEPEPAQPYAMGYLQMEETPVQSELREAFFSRLEEWGYDETRLTVTCESAAGDSAKAEKICKDFVADGVSVIVAAGDDAEKAATAAAAGKEITVIVISSEDDATVKLKSGVQQTLSLAQQIDPKLTALGLPDNGGNEVARKEVEVYCAAHEIELIPVTFDETEGSLTKAVEELCGKVTTFYTLPGTVSESVAAEAAKTAREKGLAWYAGDRFLVNAGALGAETVDLTAAGYEAADRLIQVMLQQDPGEETTLEVDCVTLNQTTIDALGLTVPDVIFESASVVTDAAEQ